MFIIIDVITFIFIECLDLKIVLPHKCQILRTPDSLESCSQCSSGHSELSQLCRNGIEHRTHGSQFSVLKHLLEIRIVFLENIFSEFCKNSELNASNNNSKKLIDKYSA